MLAGLTNDKAGRLKSLRLEIVVVDPIVPDHRVGHSYELTGITWVGQNLLVTRHPGVKNDFANCGSIGSQGAPGVVVAVVEKEVAFQGSQARIPSELGYYSFLNLWEAEVTRAARTTRSLF